MQEPPLTIKQAELLSYYDFMSYLGVPYFHIGGLTSTLKLSELCGINEDSNVLMVGCGRGFSACFIASTFGCHVTGVDIAVLSIEKARERAVSLGIDDRVEFLTDNAYVMSFKDGSFDVVITEFVSQFLDTERAFGEFARVLKVGGMVGINEMYREAGLPVVIENEMVRAENIFSEITGLPFALPSPQVWEQRLLDTGFSDVQVRRCRMSANMSEVKLLVKAMGGIGGFIRGFGEVMVKALKYSILSEKIRKRFMLLSKGKRILINKGGKGGFVGYVLAVGKKE